LTKIEQPQVCFGCHQDKRAQVNRRSHHPIEEGKVVCSDCHNSHGSPSIRLLARNSVNETCYQCHAEKRGPFLWEHQPVREDCTNCHNPHGSNQESLLNVRTPYLCQQCHQEAFHPSSLYSGTGIPPLGAAQQLLGKGCLNCHSKVHGSNHPSGSRLTR
jgi:DmsE family decaheme c-type cytochrome